MAGDAREPLLAPGEQRWVVGLSEAPPLADLPGRPPPSTPHPSSPAPALDPLHTHTAAGSTLAAAGALPTPLSPLTSHPDRGRGWAAPLRAAGRTPALLEAGRHAGRSTVTYAGGGSGHPWRTDALGAALALGWPRMLATMAAAYIACFSCFAVAWYALAAVGRGRCTVGVDPGAGARRAAVAAFMLSVEAQQTIGFGLRAPRACLASACLLAAQTVTGAALTALCAGLVFARVAHPRRAARSLFVSEAACLAKRAGVPTLSFRVLDVRPGRCKGPAVSAHLFRWAPPGAATAEGEAAPWTVDELALTPAHLPPLLLPVTVEHRIDAASPLRGATLSSLLAASAEIVVTLAAPTERGDAVVTRSFLASELHLGCAFVPAVAKGRGGRGAAVDVAAFHRVAPLPGLPPGATPAELAAAGLGGGEA